MDLGQSGRGDDDLEGPPMPSAAEVIAGLERSRADIAAGRVVPLQVVLDDLDAAAARIRARRQGGLGA